jgi:hypothetical protein
MNMEDFRKWLSSTEETAEAYQRNLAQLTRASLAEILNVKSDDLSWSLWNVDQPATAQ